MSLAGAPVPEGGWNIYNSYVTDPKYARYFTISWTGAVGVYFLWRTLPEYISRLKKGREGLKMEMDSLLGVREEWRDYSSLSPSSQNALSPKPETATRFSVSLSPIPFLLKPFGFTPIAFLRLTLGQYLLLALIAPLLLLVILEGNVLSSNPNRLGFISLSLLSPILLLALHSSPLHLAVPLPYTALNYLHRYIGRLLLIIVISHGAAWLSHPTHSPSDPTTGPKIKKGLLALSFLCFIALTSAVPVRKWNYAVFGFCHILGFVGFIIAIAMHTPYSHKWIGWGVVLPFALDAVMKLAKVRVVEFDISSASASSAISKEGEGEGTTVRLQGVDVNKGWRPGQFVVLRLFFSPASLPQGQRQGIYASLRSLTLPLLERPGNYHYHVQGERRYIAK
ncbi:hypothetical protein BT69DRAFT_1316297 [Atractiella rhizophila]|nr:hypothetical protein BT69DRAFT_1316297 [Atractiella rhizophila]